MIGSDGKGLYDRLQPAFDAVSKLAVDVQTDFAERISLIEAVFGAKPSFAAFLDGRERVAVFERVAGLIPEWCGHGLVEADVHHRYRPFVIHDADLLAVVELRSASVQTVLWASREPELAQLYRSGAQASASDDRLLGYPLCCAAWHYDAFFARGIEAFCAVAVADRSVEMRQYLDEFWRPVSGFYLPRPLFLAAILRSNWRFPFIEHIACPDCLDSPDGPSARLDAQRSELGLMLDAAKHRDLGAWAVRQERRWRDATADRARTIREHAVDNAATTRGREEYSRHARHLGKALAL